MKKVVYITGSMPPLRCGIGYYSNMLLGSLGKQADVHLITTEGLDSHPGARSTSYTKDWKLRSVRGITRQVRALRPDIVHIQYPAKGYRRQLGINILPLFLRFVVRRPVVVTLHEYFGSGLLGKSRNLITTMFANKVFLSNPYDQKALPWFIKRKSVIIPIGSNIALQTPKPATYAAISKKAGFTKPNPVVFFGFPFANKGVELLLEASQQYGFPLLMLCGFDEADPYQAELLKDINKRIAAGSEIYVTGFLDDKTVSEILQECTVFALPQPIPLTAKSGTAIAAVTHGMVVVSTAADDPAYNVPYVHHKNSLLLQTMNADTLGASINELRNDRKLYGQLKNRSKKLAAYFSWEAIAAAHCDEYERTT